MVGMTRFERATPSSQARCATKLRHIPIFSFQICSAPTVLPLTKQYLIVLFGRVKLRHIPVFSFQICSAPTVLPLTKQYSIVLFGRVKLRHIPIIIGHKFYSMQNIFFRQEALLFFFIFLHFISLFLTFFFTFYSCFQVILLLFVID